MPQDWYDYYAEQKANESNTGPAEELSTVSPPTKAAEALAYNAQWASIVALAQSNDLPTIQGTNSAMDVQSSQKVTSGNPALNHLYP